MGNGLKTDDSTVVAAFHSALLHQGLIVLLIVAVALVLLVYGSVGMIVTPGGIGLYTLLIAQILTVYSIPDVPAAGNFRQPGAHPGGLPFRVPIVFR